MIRRRPPIPLVLASAFAFAAGCGGGSSPAQPAPVPTVAPTPAPTPTPRPLSVIPACPLPVSNPRPENCNKTEPHFEAEVNAAIDRVLVERPDLFNYADINGGPRILDYEAYMIAVVVALGEGGVCGKVDAEGEIGAKRTNGFNEQWIVASHAGWNPPVGNWVRRKYQTSCIPATF